MFPVVLQSILTVDGSCATLMLCIVLISGVTKPLRNHFYDCFEQWTLEENATESGYILCMY